MRSAYNTYWDESVFDPRPSRAVDRFVELGTSQHTDNLLNYQRFREAY